MRILWHSDSPGPSGYGVGTSLFAPRIAELGHEVALSSMTNGRAAAWEWEGLKVYGHGMWPYGADTLPWHYRDHKADVLIMLGDVWAMNPATVAGLNMVAWLPVDCRPLSAVDRMFLEAAKCRIVAMSQHGQRMLADAGLPAACIPLAVDTGIFRPGNRALARAKLGIAPTTFAVGINAANASSPSRKAFPQQLAAFARFAAAHDDSVLLMHTTASSPGGIDLLPVTEDLGIQGKVRWAAHYPMVTGGIPSVDLADWYRALDVLLGASMGEGFGVPLIEAQACGTPVIGTRCSSMRELVPPVAGWLVDGVDWWDPVHRAWWVVPDPLEIRRALEKAYASGGRKRGTAAHWAVQFDADTVADMFWKPLLDEIAEAL